MFNPFKKKEDDFAFNNMDLPSLSDTNQNSSGHLTPAGQEPSNQPNNFNNPNPNELPTLPSLDEPVEATKGLNGINEQNSTPSFQEQPIPTQNLESTNPFATPNEQPMQNTQQAQLTQNPEPQKMHNEISKAKMDNISSKMELMENKISNMDHKIDLILQLIQAEVSTETKMKINMDAKMQQFR